MGKKKNGNGNGNGTSSYGSRCKRVLFLSETVFVVNAQFPVMWSRRFGRGTVTVYDPTSRIGPGARKVMRGVGTDHGFSVRFESAAGTNDE